ncbi:hypothetical protein SUGI_1088530 [Cryptomeria japonica]|nr:hypothetical protein SUGI_1088530 [Cryptomeria japonica]
MSCLSDNTNSSGSLVEVVLNLASRSELAFAVAKYRDFLIGGVSDGFQIGMGGVDEEYQTVKEKSNKLQISHVTC